MTGSALYWKLWPGVHYVVIILLAVAVCILSIMRLKHRLLIAKLLKREKQFDILKELRNFHQLNHQESDSFYDDEKTQKVELRKR